MTTIKFKLLDPSGKIPAKGTAQSAAYDVVATSIKLSPGCIEYGLGFATEIPEGWQGKVYPRSSISNYDLAMCNSVAIIDSDYRGEWKVRFRPTKQHFAEFYKVGDRIAQIQFERLPELRFELAEALTNTERAAGGFGSTGV